MDKYGKEGIDRELRFATSAKKSLDEYGEIYGRVLSDIVYYNSEKSVFGTEQIPDSLAKRCRDAYAEGCRIREIVADKTVRSMKMPYRYGKYFYDNEATAKAFINEKITTDDICRFKETRTKVLNRQKELKNEYLKRGKEVHAIHDEFISFLESVK